MTKSFGVQTDRATEYCTYCPKLCRFSCPVAEVEHRETVTPWGLMRLLEYARRGTVSGSEDVAEVFYHCTGCARCQTWCKHDNDVPKAVWQARAWFRDGGHIPEALDGFSEFFLEANSPHRVSPKLNDTTLDAFDQDAPIAFFPDCETRRYSPDLIGRIGQVLEIVLGEKVRLTTRIAGEGKACCGFPLASAGDTDGFQNYAGDLSYDLLGAEEVITDCAAFVALTRDETFSARVPIPVTYLFETLDNRLTSSMVKEEIAFTENTFLHDSCFTARHVEDGVAITRRVLGKISSEMPGEFSTNGDNTVCCGGASHYRVVAEENSDQCARDRLQQLEREGGDAVVCAGQTCAKQMARVGGEVTPLMKFVCDAVLGSE